MTLGVKGWRNQSHNTERWTGVLGRGCSFSWIDHLAQTHATRQVLPGTNLFFNTIDLGEWNLAPSQWQLQFIAANQWILWVDTISIQILLIFIATNQLKPDYFSQSPTQRAFTWMKGAVFSAVNFYSPITVSWLRKSEYELWIIEGLPRLFWKLLLLGAAVRKRLSASGSSTALLPAASGSHLSCLGLSPKDWVFLKDFRKFALLLSSLFKLKLSGQKEFCDSWSVLNTDVFEHRTEFQDLRGKKEKQEGMKKSEMCHIQDCSQVLHHQYK